MTYRKVMMGFSGLALAAVFTILSPETEVSAAERTVAIAEEKKTGSIVNEEAAEKSSAKEEATEETTEETENAEIAEIADYMEESYWTDKLLADVSNSMNIRKGASTSTSIVGSLKKGEIAEVLQVVDGWKLISVNGIEGYVSDEYTLSGEEAYDYMMENGCMTATVNTDSLRVHTDPELSSDVVGKVGKGTKLAIDTEAEETDGWIAVTYAGETCYISAEFVDTAFEIGSTNPAYAAGDEDVRLLAALIECEAGGTSYEGMLAVGSVVMNRINSSSFPDTLSGVIYQSGQFSPAFSGMLSGKLSSGNISSDAYAAAEAALAGTSNTSCLYFWAASTGHSGTVIGGNVFF